jgi:HTH-type transcriptional regulator/antitoxin HipB
LLAEAGIKRGMTQKTQAEKRETNKSYISRIENNSSQIQICDIKKK